MAHGQMVRTEPGAVFLSKSLCALTRTWSLVCMHESSPLQDEGTSLSQGREASGLPIPAVTPAKHQAPSDRGACCPLGYLTLH